MRSQRFPQKKNRDERPGSMESLSRTIQQRPSIDLRISVVTQTI